MATPETVVNKILTRTKRDKYSLNKSVPLQATLKQMKDAAYNGVWKCHGYSLEPDVPCPKCGREVS